MIALGQALLDQMRARFRLEDADSWLSGALAGDVHVSARNNRPEKFAA